MSTAGLSEQHEQVSRNSPRHPLMDTTGTFYSNVSFTTIKSANHRVAAIGKN